MYHDGPRCRRRLISFVLAAVSVGWAVAVAADGPTTAPATRPATGPAKAPAADPDDIRVRFWQRRTDEDPFDHISPTNLGAAYLWKARRTGDLSLYPKAEQALKVALDRNPHHYAALTG